MRTTIAIIASATLVVVLNIQGAAQAPSAPAGAVQSPSSQAPAGDAQKTEIATGELRAVDSTRKTVTIKNAAGVDVVFQYNDDTKVTGAQDGVAGLAAMPGRQVTIQYMMKGTDRVASSIEVAAARRD